MSTWKDVISLHWLPGRVVVRHTGGMTVVPTSCTCLLDFKLSYWGTVL